MAAPNFEFFRPIYDHSLQIEKLVKDSLNPRVLDRNLYLEQKKLDIYDSAGIHLFLELDGLDGSRNSINRLERIAESVVGLTFPDAETICPTIVDHQTQSDTSPYRAEWANYRVLSIRSWEIIDNPTVSSFFDRRVSRAVMDSAMATMINQRTDGSSPDVGDGPQLILAEFNVGVPVNKVSIPLEELHRAILAANENSL